MKVFNKQPEVLHLVTESITVEVPLSANISSYSIKESQLQNVNVIGVFARGPVVGRKTRNNIAFAAANVFQSAFLSIKDKNVNKIDSLPVEFLNTEPGEYVPIDFPNGINLDDMKLFISNTGVIASDTAIELTFIVQNEC